jgi:hypothetical protein
MVGVQSVAAISNATLFHNIFICSIGIAGMFWPLGTQGADTEKVE